MPQEAMCGSGDPHDSRMESAYTSASILNEWEDHDETCQAFTPRCAEIRFRRYGIRFAAGVRARRTNAPLRKNRIHQSVCRWCYKEIALDQLCAFAAGIGMKGIDLLQPRSRRFRGVTG